ncbi:MAG TPA: anti-sigma factor domain-containing protein [Acetivibrio clariflavus]|nr:anti-sigma factor domain-containing protein [Acetivibrio clariflavus]HPU41600.1 anti-sigma factor domain-containing protein [Acetivibrio clariflavus]
MECLGVVLQIKDNKAYLMTDSCEVVCIKKQPGMYEGMEIIFDYSEKINISNTFVKYSSVVAGVAAVFIAIMLYIGMLPSNRIYAYIDVDLNTNWQLMVNKDNKVIDVKINDSNSKFLMEGLNFKSKPLDKVLVDMVEKLKNNGMIDLNSQNKVLITTCLNDDEIKDEEQGYKNLEPSFRKIKDELLDRNIETYFLKAESEDRKLAADNNISVGRYSIYKNSKEKGINIDLEKLKENNISEILEKVDVGNELDIDKSNTDQSNQNLIPTDNGKENNGDKNGNEKKGNDKNGNNKNENEKKGNESYNSEDIDLSLGGTGDIDALKSLEAANIETQKVIQAIQQQVYKNIANETEKANMEISKIKYDPSMSIEQKNKKIKEIESELIKKIEQIKKEGNEKAQAELSKLEKKAKDLLPQIK